MNDLASLRSHLDRFYASLDNLACRLGGPRMLAQCDGRMDWPDRGVYFFFEPGEKRAPPNDSQARVVRVGTHAVSADSGTSLWERLKAHRGTGAPGDPPGGGNHRGSIFRKHVGSALLRAGRSAGAAPERWGIGSSASSVVVAREQPLERLVSEHIGRMPFVWLEADDEPSATSIRGYIERNSIALLARAAALEPPSAAWLGRHAADAAIRSSGLWNVKHVNETYDPKFLEVLERLASGLACSEPAHAFPASPAELAPQQAPASNRAMTLALVACAKKKTTHACPAEQLYQPSSQFRAAYEYAGRVAARTMILSAKHGLLRPEAVTAPYEQTLVGAPRADQRRWAARVYEQLQDAPEYRAATTVVWLAGVDYRAFLLPMVARDGKDCVIPMEGLTQGRQKAWLKAQLAGPVDSVQIGTPAHRPSAEQSPPRSGLAAELPRRPRPTDEMLDPELMALILGEWRRDPVFRTLGPNPMPNHVTAVTAAAVSIQTERSLLQTGGTAEVPAWMLNLAWNHLRTRGELTNAILLKDLRVHRSSAVCAILARLPGVVVTRGDGIGLAWAPRTSP